MKTAIGLFDSFREAESAARDLVSAGFSRDDLSLLASDAAGEWSRYKASTVEGAELTSEEIGSGIGTGTVVGGLGGLFAGLGTFAIPGIGPVAAAGTAATTLLGAGVGAAAGGLIAAIDELGVPKDQTGYYAEAVRRGGILISVRVPEEQVDEAMAIMERHHAMDVDERAAEWRAGGWNQFNEKVEPYSKDE
ncbi:MAG: hypothetical protein ACREXW_15555 [Gammaproteobacteria bacterium]